MMKPIRFLSLVAIGLMLSFAATGCRTRPQGLTTLPGRHDKTTVGDIDGKMIHGQPPSGDFVGYETGPGHPGWRKDAQALAANTVHFDLDSSAIKTVDKPNVAAVADYLKGNSASAVEIEGHCDERGTEGYNQSLGERRALAIREELIGLGIDPKRVDTISYGEARPVETGHDEGAWAKNRRGEFIVLSPPIN